MREKINFHFFLLYSLVTLVFPLLLLLVSCQSKSEPTVLPVTIVSKKPEETDQAPTSWQEVLDKAGKEKKVVVNSGLPPEARQAITNGFHNRYSIDIEWVTGRGEELARKIRAERRAGIYSYDIYFGGSTTFLLMLKPEGVADPLEPALLLPEVKDLKGWFEGKIPFLDKDKRLFSFGMNISPDLAIFTREVQPQEATSWKDLLKPRFKGKAIMEDPTVPGAGLRWFGAVGEYLMSYDYMRELAKQEVIITKDSRQVVEWTARGKTLISVSPHSDIVKEFANAGAPIKGLMVSEGTYITSGWGNVALINKAPHPNAAKVFINWLLSKEGQLAYSKSRSLEVLRIDISKDHLEPSQRYDPKMKIVNTATEEYTLAQAEQMKKAREIFGHLIQ